MHAVVVSLTITDSNAAGEALHEQLVPRVSRAPGFIAGYWTVKGDTALSLFMFETEGAANLMSEQHAFVNDGAGRHRRDVKAFAVAEL